MKIKGFSLVVFCFYLWFAQCSDGNQKTGAENSEFSKARLENIISNYLKKHPRIHGVIVKLHIEGDKTYEAAGGHFDLRRTIPLKPEVRFLIGSVTKVFTSVLVHMLFEKGKIKLSDPVLNHLPPDWVQILEKIKHGTEITIDQLLSHRSGLGSMTGSEHFRKSLFADHAVRKTPIDILEMVQQNRAPQFKPGDNYDYNNTNYIILGALIEHEYGMSFREALKRYIQDPIGLRNTGLMEKTFAFEEDAFAHGFPETDDKTLHSLSIGVEWARAPGGLISNSSDLIRFYRALVSGELFHKKKTYASMTELVGYNETYGRGIQVFDDPEIGKYYGHMGNFMETRTVLAFFPEKGITACVCLTCNGFSMTTPEDLLRKIILDMKGMQSTGSGDVGFEGPEILEDLSNLIVNKDQPVYGDWNFKPQEKWSLKKLDHYPLGPSGNLHVDKDGFLYLLNRGLAKIFVLDAGGTLQYSFGEHGDGPNFEYPLDLYVTSNRIHVLDMGKTGDLIKTYDKKGHYLGTTKILPGISPRIFVDDDRYIAVRSGPDILNRPEKELLGLFSLQSEQSSVITKFPRENKLILTAKLPMGRYILLEDDIHIFSRMIVHYDSGRIYLGRNDRYVIKRVDMNGKEDLSFSIQGRSGKSLPTDYAVRLAGRTRVGRDKEMSPEMKEKFIEGFPPRQTVFTQIATDEQGLIYIFVPDISFPEKQQIDIFSPDGKYLYRSVFKLPEGFHLAKPLVMKDDRLFALIKDNQEQSRLVKYRIQTPQ